MITQEEFENRIEAINKPSFNFDKQDEVLQGWQTIFDKVNISISEYFSWSKKSVCLIALDGFVGTEWSEIIPQLQEFVKNHKISAKFINVDSCLKSEFELKKQFEPYLGEDPVFGKLYKKELKSLFNSEKTQKLKSELSSIKKAKHDQNNVVFICGTGAALPIFRKSYNAIFYFDLTREEVLKRNKMWTKLAGKTQSISPKKLYYIDFQVNDKHRNYLLKFVDFYVDHNKNDEPILLSNSAFEKITNTLARWPFRLKPMYEPGPWGGQWLRKVRKLPGNWVNCAWSFEVIAQEMSLNVQVFDAILELPWNTFFHTVYKKIMGNVPKRRFGGQFPVRYDYLDTMNGGDLSVQVHPPTKYIKKHFNEPYHQGEMYYIMEAENGATVNLGLHEKTNIEDFHRDVKQADEKNIAFDYKNHIYSVPSKKHDLLFIPPGTVHGSGEGQVVLEISATTYRYTFKIYDHLRPDLNGIMRPVHVDHAFNVIKWFRRKKWVDKNLWQKSQKIRFGKDWAEYLIGDRRDFFHVVFRQEFESEIEDNTEGKFHILTLVAGESVLLFSLQNPQKKFLFNYSETIIVPACFGRYKMINQSKGVCKTAKARLR